MEAQDAGSCDASRPSASDLFRDYPPPLEVHIDGAVEWPIRSATGLVELVRVGTSRRTVAAHSLNGESSRSHAFLTVRVLSAVGGPAGAGWAAVVGQHAWQS